MHTRRNTLKLGLGLAAGIALPAGRSLAANNFAGRRVVYATWGGDYERAQTAAYCDTFKAQTGAEVIVQGPVSPERVRVMLESGSADWQVICANDALMYGLGKAGLLAPVDTKIVDVNRVPADLRWEYGIAMDMGCSLIAYSTKAFSGSKTPRTWADFFDLKTFPGRRMMSANPRAMLEVALLGDGVAPADLYPLNVERALAKLDTIKSDIVFAESYSQAQQLLVDGAAVIGPLFSNRAYTVIKNGGALGVSWENNLRNITPLIVPKAAVDKDLCWALVNHMLDPKNQALVADQIAVSPTNPEAIKYVKPELAAWLPANPENNAKGITVNVDYWGANQTAISQRWQEWKLL